MGEVIERKVCDLGFNPLVTRVDEAFMFYLNTVYSATRYKVGIKHLVPSELLD